MGKIGKLLLIIIVVFVLGGGISYLFISDNTSANVTLWTANNSDLKNRLSAIGFPSLTQEGTALHTHQHLDIYINGNHVLIPSDIGIDPAGKFISPIHTHDTSGIIHVESPTVQNFTLGQFFKIWGVTLNNNCIGDFCNDNTHKLAMYVNGQLYTGNYLDLSLQPYQEISIIYGTQVQLSTPVPSSYQFPSGY